MQAIARMVSVRADRTTPERALVAGGQERPVPLLCAGILGLERHDWLYLAPSREEKEQIRELLTCGEGELGAIGARPDQVYDRVCRSCLRPQSRIKAYIAALKAARGVE